MIFLTTYIFCAVLLFVADLFIRTLPDRTGQRKRPYNPFKMALWCLMWSFVIPLIIVGLWLIMTGQLDLHDDKDHGPVR